MSLLQYSWWELAFVRWGGEQSQVVDRVIIPLLEHCELNNLSCYLDTDWWQGPHVSLCFRASDMKAEALKERGLLTYAQELLSELGAGPTVDPLQYQDLHERLALYERRPGPLQPWLPDGQVVLRPLVSREKHTENTELYRTVQQAQVALLDVELVLFGHIARGELSVEAHALDLLSSVAARFTDSDLCATYPSFASHAEAYLAMDAGAGTRERWDAAYIQRKESFLRLLEERTRQAQIGALPYKTRIVINALTKIVDRVDPLELFGGSALPAFNGTFSSSEFHIALDRNQAWENSVRHNAWFARYRLILNLVYRHLSKLGLTPHHRFYICYLLTQAAQDLTHTTAIEVLRGFSSD
ncbi:hypothetical protein OS128_06650 [Corynebacterium sp. P5848]|uniref:lantibiotic dehydratase C-terminal domain-containing protein n=1 Tax=Corynebacterium marambiense TaxID=2765364 RepID=UPI002260966A|nr:lantibiotic dehydratase C-terminal domain-containing protein [Corynebacterium marambiense]MCX7542591.1 hypothetical protein [Corynebacterium marambiense]